MACHVDTRLAPHVGLCRPIRPPRNLILHMPSRRCVDSKAGIVYGAAGTPVGGVCADGYVRLGQHRDGHQYAHRLIYEAVHGAIPPRHYVDHVNGKRADNRIANLQAVTPAENVARAFERGAVAFGEAARVSKLTAAQVREIRQTVGEVATREWARQLDVDPATIRAVRDGKTWRHVPLRGPLPERPRWKRPRPTVKRK
ncbi:MAG: HNH endonuclease signature motif containing protein [Cypionkella sp.]